MNEDLNAIFDLEYMVINTLTNNKELLCNIFIQCGYKELQFIRNMGGIMGFIFGLIQMSFWFYYDNPILLPIVGLIIGAFTNWLALFIIFNPIEPIFIGKYAIQGLFLKRQHEVANVYAKTISQNLMTSENIIKHMITGPCTDQLFYIMNKHMQQAFDNYIGQVGNFFIKYTMNKQYKVIKNQIISNLIQETPYILSFTQQYSDNVLDMENLLRDKLSSLPSNEFERLLHPVFEEDEYKLIIVGGVLGFIIGLLQMYFLNG